MGGVHKLLKVLTSFEPCSPPTPQARPREPARRHRQKQIRSCIAQRERASAPVPGGGSTPTGPRFEQTAFPQGVCEYQRSDSCSSSSSASTVSNEPRWRYRSSTSEAVNAGVGRVLTKSS